MVHHGADPPRSVGAGVPVRRGIVQATLQRVIGRLKHDNAYRIEYEYPNRDLIEVAWRRLREAWRGLFVRRRLGRSAGVVFAGRRVTIRHGRYVMAGTSLQIGDDVLVEGLSTDGIRLGRNVTLVRGAALVCTGVIARPGVGISIGDRSAIGDHSFLGGQGGIAIGSDVLFGPGVRVFSENHEFGDVDTPIRMQGETRAPVTIEDDCWIGAGSTILGGVHIGRGAVIGAGSVVSRDVPPYAVVVGVPARVISFRDGHDRSAVHAPNGASV
jgi:acetyltransferase-like isoleucine patch superfamily enzyme